MADDDRSPFHYSCLDSNFEDMKKHFSQELVNKTDSMGYTPLISATAAQLPKVVRYLLDNGADISIKNIQNCDAFFYAVANCNDEILDMFLEKNYKNWDKNKHGINPVHRAFMNPKCTINFIDKLFNLGAPKKVTDNEGNTYMHIACYENRLDLANYLKDNHGASFTSPLNRDEKTPEELIPPKIRNFD